MIHLKLLHFHGKFQQLCCCGFKPTASIEIDSSKVSAANLAALEAILYGTVGADPYLPLPDEVAAIFAGAAPSAIAMSSIVPADSASSVAVDANIVMTFNNKISRESIVVTNRIGSNCCWY